MSTKNLPGVGLDVGTMNIVAARRTAPDKVETSRVRDAFLDLNQEAKRMLKLSGVNFIEKGENIIVVGDKALEMANVFGREARRPLNAGLISAGEIDALEVLGAMIKNLLGEPKTPGEYCYFSVPAAPVDDLDRDVVYHQGVFERIVTECGYTAVAGNEAMAIVYAETAAEGFSGLGISFGSGMCNLALSISGMEGFSFSVARGGDWIDAGASKAVGATQSRMCALKEKGIDLLTPKSREEEALALYYKSLITYCLDHTAKQFARIKDRFSMPGAIPIVVSGGTSLAGNFLEFFKQTFEGKRKKFPFEVSEIRQASDPLNAVARGLLIQSIQEYDE